MKLIWSGAGFLVPILSALGFMGFVVALDAQQKDDFWAWGALALGIAVIVLPVGLLVNSAKRRRARGGRHHHFMYLPLQYWGAIFLVAGAGLMIAEGVTGMGSEASASVASSGACAELGEVLGECPSLGPAGAAMMQAGCEASDPATQSACLACVQSSGNACDPSGCRSACRFGPPGAP